MSECCPLFHPEKWDEKKITWKARPFVMESIPAFFHIPFPPMIGKKITRMMGLIEAAGMEEKKIEDTLILFRDPTPFRSEIYISTAGPVNGAKNTELSGNFAAKVFDGNYNDIPKFAKVMREYLKSKLNIPRVEDGDFYVHYAYCPKCQKKFGHNYMILFARIG